jgi:ribosomal protein S18 acetylase RimI-like enzyme
MDMCDPSWSISRAGTRLLQRTLEKALEDPNIVEACLHVQTSNEEAIRFYKKFGFAVAETLRDYYKRNRLDPPDAYVLRKSLAS